MNIINPNRGSSRKERKRNPMLLFEKISCHPRRAEPVTVSIPCGLGRLRPGQGLVIQQDGHDLPLQTRVLARWPDRSAKWLLVDFQPDLPGNAAVSLPFAIVDMSAAIAPPAAIVLRQAPEGIAVDTGAISFLVPRRGFAPVTDVTLHQGPTWPNPCGGFLLTASGRSVGTAEAECTLDLEEPGPLRAVIVVRGKHRDAAGGWLDFRGRVTAYAGKPYIEVEHQFIHAEAEAQIDLASLTLRLAPQTTGTPRWALGEGYYRTQIEVSGPQARPLARLIDAELILRQNFEHYVDCFYGDFWADWRDAQGGLAVTIHQAHQNFPKGLVADASGIICQLYPEGQPLTAIRQGMAKTHRILLHFHGPDEPLDRLSVRSLQFQLPDRPALSHDWMLGNDPWGDGLCAAEVGDRVLGELIARFMDRHTALGMLHFGDAPDAGYSVGFSGGAQTVWINNEYDHAHNCAQFHFQTGERAALDAALVAARHWLDVDLCHYSPDPLQHGGLWAHTVDHAPPVGMPGGVAPSHEWVDAFLDYYFLTGRGEGLEAAQSVADNVLRQLERPALRDIAQLSVRELGWALDTLVAMALGTGEQRWRDAADEVVGRLLRWHDRFGSFLAPYTSHSMPRVPFMIALTGNSLARYTRLQPNPRIDALVVSMTDDLIAHMRGPDGVFVYKEFPSLRRPFAPPQVLHLLTHAWRITGDLCYLRVGVRQLAYTLRQPVPSRDFAKRGDPCGAVLLGASSSSGATFAFNYPGTAAFAAAARPLGLLAWLEYPEVDEPAGGDPLPPLPRGPA